MDDPQKKLSWSEPLSAAPIPAVVSSALQPPKVPSQPASIPSATSAGVPVVRYASFAAAAVVVVALGAWFMGGASSSGAENTSAQSNQPAASAAAGSVLKSTSAPSGVSTASTNNLVIGAQKAGFVVVVNKVSISAPTWVVVYEYKAGRRGNALGAALFVDATRQSGTVELLRATRAGETYVAGESVDNGDRRFSMKDDTPVTTVAGELLLVPFTVK